MQHLATEDQNHRNRVRECWEQGSQRKQVPKQQSHCPRGHEPCVLPSTQTIRMEQARPWGRGRGVGSGRSIWPLPGTANMGRERGREGALRSKQKALRASLRGPGLLPLPREGRERRKKPVDATGLGGGYVVRGGGRAPPPPPSFRSVEFSPGRKGPPSHEWKQSLASGPGGVQGLKQSGIITLPASPPPPAPRSVLRGNRGRWRLILNQTPEGAQADSSGPGP